MAATYSSRDIVEDYLRYKLLSGGVAWHFPLLWRHHSLSLQRPQPGMTSHLAQDHLLQAPPQLQVVLRSAGDRLEQRYHSNLSAHVSALRQWEDSSGAARRRSLVTIRDELFSDGVNWGRIVAMMALGGALSVEAVRTGEMAQVDDIADWMEESLNLPLLRGWIEDNGGWDAFVELYESSPPVSFWSLRTVFGLVVLGAAGIVLATLFTQR